MKVRRMLIGILLMAAAVCAEPATAIGRDSPKGKPQLPPFSAENEAVALKFVEQHHAELAPVLARLKSVNTAEYQQAIREVFQVTATLAGSQDAKYSELLLEAWKTNSRAQLLAARLSGIHGPTAKLAKEMELKELLHKYFDLQTAMLDNRRQAALATLDAMEANLKRLRENHDKLVESRFRALTVIPKKPAVPPPAKEKKSSSRTDTTAPFTFVSFEQEPAADPAGVAFFESRIRPVLAKHCYQCHADKAAKGKLRLDTRDAVRTGGVRGPAIVPGEAAKSLLLKAIRQTDEDFAMPPRPNSKLPDHVIADFEKWIKMGAPDPRDRAVAEKKGIDIAKAKEFWAFQRPRPTKAPAVKNADWPRSDTDRFVLARLEDKGLKPVADADPLTLLRRLTFALTGLPPTVQEMDEFAGAWEGASAKRQAAIENLVDRLLDSPRFGERWGRHWLDVARYAETNGRDFNTALPHAWRYRDWVIDAFNADVPYDRFVAEQIAGDLLPYQTQEQRDRQIVATGFLAVGPKVFFEPDRERYWMEVVDEQLSTTATAFLGLSVGCARCHDHKFDAIPTKDYYALAGIFRSTDIRIGLRLYGIGRPWSRLIPLGAKGPELAKAFEEHEGRIEIMQNKLGKTRNQLLALPMKQREGETGLKLKEEMNAIQKEMDELRKQSPAAPDYAMAVWERPAPIDCRVLIGGEPDAKGDLAPRGYLSVLPSGAAIGTKGSGRMELAQWLTSAENPLTARVMVNRVWHQLFGRGIVETVDNFGIMGARPSHPELLDHLAVRFSAPVGQAFQPDGQARKPDLREGGLGWSVKKLIRTIVLSRTYQLGSATDKDHLAVDPDNMLLWRMSQRRLDAEALRDAMLAVSGKIDFARPEPSIYVRSNNLNSGQIFRSCRTVYLPLGRDTVSDYLTTFDFTDPNLPAGSRTTTTVPAQSLFFMNSFFVTQHARFFAERMKVGDVDRRIESGFKLAYGRLPTEGERLSSKQFLAKLDQAKGARIDPWPLFCQALFASAEFRYVR